MSKKYQNLLSPLKVGNIVFKNRLFASHSAAYFNQGPEQYPTEARITNYANKAKNGAAMVTCKGSPSPIVKQPKPQKLARSLLGLPFTHK